MTGKTTFLALLALIAASPLSAKPQGLTVKAGETWTFTLSRGQPVRAHKASQTSRLREGQILVTVRSMMGTSMTITSYNSQAYTYRAKLVGVAGGKSVPGRACTLPADGKISFEHWPQQASAVHLSDFRPARKDGSCP